MQSWANERRIKIKEIKEEIINKLSGSVELVFFRLLIPFEGTKNSFINISSSEILLHEVNG